MKTNKIIIFALLFIFYSCSSEVKIEEEVQEEYFIGLTNTITQSRKNEPIAIARERLEELTTVFPSGTIPVVFGEDGEEVPVQADDMDGDGTWDEISFIYPVLPKYTAPLKVEVQPISSASDYKKRTNVVIYDLDDERSVTNSLEKLSVTSKNSSSSAAAWENDKLAFKVRFTPERKMEIIGKRTERMILNKKDFEKQGFMVRSRGKRLFHKSDSISPGTIAFLIDSTYYNIENYDSLTYQIITEGPVRSVLKINFNGLKIKNKKFNLEENITIWANQEGYRSTLSLQNLEEVQTIATAISNEETDSLAISDMEGQYFAIASYNFKENDELEAFGIVLPQIPKIFSDSIMFRKNPDQFIPFDLGENRSVPLYYYFGWQGEEKSYKDPDTFHSMLDKEVNRIKNPILIDRYIQE